MIDSKEKNFELILSIISTRINGFSLMTYFLHYHLYLDLKKKKYHSYVHLTNTYMSRENIDT